MEAIASLTSALAGQEHLVALVLLASGLGFVATLAASALKDRRHLRRRAQDGLEGAAVATAQGGGDPGQALHKLIAVFERSLAGGDEKQNRLLRTQLVQAGFFDPKAVPIYMAARVLAALALTGLTAAVLPFAFGQLDDTAYWMFVGALGISGYFLPTLYLKQRIGSRTDAHRKGFPDFMDLMVVCSEAGLSMEAAIERIARELVEGHPSLAENLYMVSLEIRAGKPFAEALERMGRRVGIEEASMLATLLQQSAELGTSLSQSLRIYSDEMRNKRMSKAEEKAYALPAKLVIPLTLFVFPVLIVTLLYPAVVRVFNM